MLRAPAAIFVLALVVGALAPPAWAQGCALCRTQVEATGEQAAQAFDTAILMMLVPTVLLFGSVLVVAFRRNHQTWPETEEDTELSAPQERSSSPRNRLLRG